ncbi:MAG: thrombospondin type 3 repeat-containing protein [Polyangiales bacterium]
MGRHPLTLALLAVAATMVSARTAYAVSAFPRTIESQLALGYQPPCSICHEYGKTGSGTVITPFGLSLRTRGLVSSDKNSIKTALNSDESDAEDSDGDGIPDTVELVNGTDPNSASNASIIPSESPAAQLGCGVRRTPGGGSFASAMGIVAAVLAARTGKRKRSVTVRSAEAKTSGHTGS